MKFCFLVFVGDQCGCLYVCVVRYGIEYFACVGGFGEDGGDDVDGADEFVE